MKEEQKDAVLEAMHQRRSIRAYTDEDVAREEIETVLEAGRWAPSGLNNQPWRFLVVRAGDRRQEALAEQTKYGHVVRRAKVLIGVYLDREAKYDDRKDNQGAGACIQNMLLAVHALGLGAVWLGEIINHEPDVVEAAGLDPARYEMMALLAVGRPDQKGSSDRKPLDDLLLEPLA
ncbi:nitroreductase family protein [Desulfohalovibrio reitneri]|uniref:nitroreductase family protein n=1 Tax=Desulfohalovibrio reitneri TaxID=1307759 RepID=UPI0004A72C3E|nr:nitroreductase [Desulfohalovibrio reitneri]